MKEIDEIVILGDRRYTREHEWAKRDGDRVRVGITDYAQDQLGDVVFVELPDVGAAFAKGDVFGCVESVKAVSDLFSPVGGTVLEVNGDLETSPQLVNEGPYAKGWMIALEPSEPDELNELLSDADYLQLLKDME